MTERTLREKMLEDGGDMMFDDSSTIRMTQEFGKSIDAEIEAAGGLEAWRAKHASDASSQPLAA